MGGRRSLADLVQEDKRQKDENLQEAAAVTEKGRGILESGISEVQDCSGHSLRGWKTGHCLAAIGPEVAEHTFILVEIKVFFGGFS